MCHYPIWREQTGFIMDESYLDVLFGCTPFSDMETLLSPIDGTKGHYISNNPSASVPEETDNNLDLHSLGTASISAGINRSISEATSHVTAIVKEIPMKLCPLQIPRKKDVKTFVVKNVPRSSTTCMPIFRAYLAEQLGVHGVGTFKYTRFGGENDSM